MFQKAMAVSWVFGLWKAWKKAANASVVCECGEGDTSRVLFGQILELYVFLFKVLQSVSILWLSRQG